MNQLFTHHNEQTDISCKVSSWNQEASKRNPEISDIMISSLPETLIDKYGIQSIQVLLQARPEKEKAANGILHYLYFHQISFAVIRLVMIGYKKRIKLILKGRLFFHWGVYITIFTSTQTSPWTSVPSSYITSTFTFKPQIYNNTVTFIMFSCCVCGRAFGKRSNMRSHERMCHERMPSQCPYCPRVLKWMMQHIRRQHRNIYLQIHKSQLSNQSLSTTSVDNSVFDIIPVISWSGIYIQSFE